MGTETKYQIFVTFSGETGKGGSTPIQEVQGIAVLSDGSAAPPTSVVGPFLEPRGMAMDAYGNLYVAQAEKSATAIFAYTNVGGFTSDGPPLVVAPTYPSPGTSYQSPALLHPYGLALNGSGTLFVSSQDTNVVSAYKLSFGSAKIPRSAAAAETSPALSAVYGGTFYPGQYVMTSVPLKENPKITTVPQILGGLDYTKDTSAHSVRGIAILNDTLYVVDEAAALVGTYALPSGTFTGWITTFGLNMPAMTAPVGIATNDNKVYVGDSGSATIYEWTPAGGSTPGSLSVYLTDDTLKKVSGIAFLPDGSLVWGSREPVTAADPPDPSADPAAHKSSNATFSIYRYVSNAAVQTWASGFSDTPECLLCVEVSSG